MTGSVADAIELLADRIGRLEKAVKAPPRLAYRPREVADMTGIKYERVLELIHDGRLRAVKEGRLHIVPADALTEFLAEDTAT